MIFNPYILEYEEIDQEDFSVPWSISSDWQREMLMDRYLRMHNQSVGLRQRYRSSMYLDE